MKIVGAIIFTALLALGFILVDQSVERHWEELRKYYSEEERNDDNKTNAGTNKRNS